MACSWPEKLFAGWQAWNLKISQWAKPSKKECNNKKGKVLHLGPKTKYGMGGRCDVRAQALQGFGTDMKMRQNLPKRKKRKERAAGNTGCINAFVPRKRELTALFHSLLGSPLLERCIRCGAQHLKYDC